MTKYQDLQKVFAKEVADIKSLQVQEAQLSQEVQKAYNEIEQDDMPIPPFDLEEKLNGTFQALQELQAALRYEIDLEYAEVPFEASRKKGIEGFYRLAGI